MNWIRNARQIPRIILTIFGAIMSLAGLVVGAHIAYAQEATSTGPTTYSASVNIVNVIPEMSPITVPVIISTQETPNTTATVNENTPVSNETTEQEQSEVTLTPVSIEITPIGSEALVTTVATGATACPAVDDYLKEGWANNSVQMIKLQDFLRDAEGSTIASTGTFDEATLAAVKSFQEKYASDVLTPWGISVPTGFVYVTTKNKINEIACGTDIPFTQDELALLSGARSSGATVAMTSTDTEEAQETTSAATEGGMALVTKPGSNVEDEEMTDDEAEMTEIEDGNNEVAMEEDDKKATSTSAIGSWGGTLAAALFAVPEDAQALYKAGANIILILALLAIAWLVLKEYVFYRKGLPKEERVNRTRLIFFAIGSLIASVAMAFSPTPAATLPLFALFVILLVMIFTQGVGMAPLAMQGESNKGGNSSPRNNMVPMKTENRAPLSQKHGSEQQKNK